jgi:hypothetical protein
LEEDGPVRPLFLRAIEGGGSLRQFETDGRSLLRAPVLYRTPFTLRRSRTDNAWHQENWAMSKTRNLKELMNPDIMTVADEMTTDELAQYLIDNPEDSTCPPLS